MRRSPELQHNAWPAASTIGDILKRNCLIEAKRRRRKPIAQGEIVSGSDEPNGEWAIDFKGWFRTLCGTRCDPLTITDTASRYLIETRIIDPTWAGVRSTLERFFRTSACRKPSARTTARRLVQRVRAGCRACRYGALKSGVGIAPRYIPPSSAQDNGRHERMHRTFESRDGAASGGDCQRAAGALRPVPAAL